MSRTVSSEKRSREWGLGCRTCAANPGADFFSGEFNNVYSIGALAGLVHEAKSCTATGQVLDLVERFSGLDRGDRYDLLRFLLTHPAHLPEHDLAPMDDHRRFADQCSQYALCACCGRSGSCTLDSGHTGACSPTTAKAGASAPEKQP